MLNLDPDSGIPRVMARHEGLPRAEAIFCGIALCFKPSKIKKADTADAADIRMAFGPTSSSPALAFGDVRFGKYRAAIQDAKETILVRCMPHAADKLVQHVLTLHVRRFYAFALFDFILSTSTETIRRMPPQRLQWDRREPDSFRPANSRQLLQPILLPTSLCLHRNSDGKQN